MINGGEPIAVKIVPAEIDGHQVAQALFGLAVAGATMALMIYLQRKLSGPDVFVTIKMRCLKTVAENADKGAIMCRRVSAAADTAYLMSRP